MDRVVVRERSAQASPRELWKSIPLECAFSALAIFVAAGLKLAGLMP